ncbi:MAG: polysaccharide biosynthesis C-terminal domain-containing protein [Desulfobacteraceae bacterium]|nr:polysaccharide biosynthesis C-terminal domain-containing protein [Desulfobacteraceae bacterium]
MPSLLRLNLASIKTYLDTPVNRKILSATTSIAVTTMIVKLASMWKEMVVADKYGRAADLDAFLLAFIIPSFLINILAGSVNAALIPTFIQTRTSMGRQAAQKLLSSALCLVLAVFVLLSLAIILIFPLILPCIVRGFDPERLRIATLCFYQLLPVFVISGLGTTWRAVLNAYDSFAFPSFAAMGIPIATIVALFVFTEQLGIYAYSAGTVAGFALEAALIGWKLHRLGVSIVPRWHGISEPLRRVIHQYFPMIMGTLLSSSNTLVDVFMSSALDAGSVSALNYGGKVVSLLLGIGAMACGTAALPQFSHMVAAHDWAGIRKTNRTYLSLIFIVSIPACAVLIYFSDTIISLIFQRGAFRPEDTLLVSQVQVLYMLQVPFYAGCIFIAQLISALRGNQALVYANIINFTLNVLLDYLFMQWYGVRGIALATSAVVCFAFCFLLFLNGRILRNRSAALSIK